MTTTMAAKQSLDRLQSALITKFPPDKVDEALFFFNKLRKEARHEHWDTCINDGGKFVEAVLKCFHYLRTGIEVDSINVDEEVRSLEQTTALSDFERLIIPSALKLTCYRCFSSIGSVVTSLSLLPIFYHLSLRKLVFDQAS